jgi:hypothetical protein
MYVLEATVAVMGLRDKVILANGQVPCINARK